MNENVRELAKQLHEAQAKHTDFLLALAASCIALSVHRTTGIAPRWSMLILAVAVLSWAASILAGVRNRQYFQSIIHANIDLLKIEAGQEPEVGTHPQRIAAASAGILKAVEYNNQKAVLHANSQLNLLLLGAALFLVWHVIEMFNAAPVKAP